MTEKQMILNRYYDRRDSLKRLLKHKRKLGHDTLVIEDLIEANQQNIDLFEKGSGLDPEYEAAVNAGFMAMNGL